MPLLPVSSTVRMTRDQPVARDPEYPVIPPSIKWKALLGLLPLVGMSLGWVLRVELALADLSGDAAQVPSMRESLTRQEVLVDNLGQTLNELKVLVRERTNQRKQGNEREEQE